MTCVALFLVKYFSGKLTSKEVQQACALEPKGRKLQSCAESVLFLAAPVLFVVDTAPVL